MITKSLPTGEFNVLIQTGMRKWKALVHQTRPCHIKCQGHCLDPLSSLLLDMLMACFCEPLGASGVCLTSAWGRPAVVGGLFPPNHQIASNQFWSWWINSPASSLLIGRNDSEVRSTESSRGLQEEQASVTHSRTCSWKHPLSRFFPYLSHFPAPLSVLPGITSPVSLLHSHLRTFFQGKLRSDLHKT